MTGDCHAPFWGSPGVTPPGHPTLTFQVIAVGNESLVFLIRRTDFNGGWNQPLKVEILLVGGTKDVGETKD